MKVFFLLYYNFVVLPPPVDVRAIQSNPSAPVEVSWSPPANQGVFNITGYRVFYGSRRNVSISSVLTIVGLMVSENYDGQTLFLRSESEQLFSENVNVTVGKVVLEFVSFNSAPLINIIIFLFST